MIGPGTCGFGADTDAKYGGNFCSFLPCSGRGQPFRKRGAAGLFSKCFRVQPVQAQSMGAQQLRRKEQKNIEKALAEETSSSGPWTLKKN